MNRVNTSTGLAEPLVASRALEMPCWFCALKSWVFCAFWRFFKINFSIFQKFKAAKVTLNEYEFSWNKLANIQPQLEKLVSQNFYLNKSAREAYKGYIRAYDSHSLKQIYNVNTLDLVKVIFWIFLILIFLNYFDFFELFWFFKIYFLIF